MKKFLGILCMLVLVIGLTGCGASKEEEINDNTLNNNNQVIEDNTNNDSNENTNGKNLVLYFSATGTTEKVAKTIASVTGGYLVEIVPKDEYSSTDLNYSNDNCRANKEQNDSKSRPAIQNTINIDGYDTIFIGYPIWWGTNPRIIETLLDTYNFDGKNVALFATSGGSSISQSERNLKAYNTKMNVLGSKLFNGSLSNSDVESWIKSLNK